MILKQSVRNNYYRETRETRENSNGLFLLVRTLRVLRGS